MWWGIVDDSAIESLATAMTAAAGARRRTLLPIIIALLVLTALPLGVCQVFFGPHLWTAQWHGLGAVPAWPPAWYTGLGPGLGRTHRFEREPTLAPPFLPTAVEAGSDRIALLHGAVVFSDAPLRAH